MVTNLTPSDLNIVQRKGYKFESLLGEGAYAKVFSVACIKPERRNTKLACKYINQTEVPVEFTKKFLPRELSVLLKIKHPNIIHVHSIFLYNNKCFIFMRLAEAGDVLSYLIKLGELNEKHARLWFHQLAQAVQYIHILGIVHRDIKLENVFISINMNVKLGDFGFAKYILNDNGELQLSETFCGSQQYAAPEIIKGTAYNPKLADVWSLGCVLFAMLNRKLPFDNNDTAKFYELQMTHRYKYRDYVLNNTSVEVKNLIFHILEPNTSLRFDIEAVVKSDWLRQMPSSDAQKMALDSAMMERKIKSKTGMDAAVSILRNENKKQQYVIKEESWEDVDSKVVSVQGVSEQTQNIAKEQPKPAVIKLPQPVDSSNQSHNQERRMTRPFKYDDIPPKLTFKK